MISEHLFGNAESPRVDEPNGAQTVSGGKVTAMGLLKGLLFHGQNSQEFLDDLVEYHGSASGNTRVVGNGDVLDFVPSLDTAQYAADDVLFDTQELTGAFRVAGGQAFLHSVSLLDTDDQNVAIDLLFLDGNYSIGTENSAVSVSDANAGHIMGAMSFATADYTDLVNSRYGSLGNLGLKLKAAPGSTSLWIAGILRSGTPTFTASGIKMKIGLMWD